MERGIALCKPGNKKCPKCGHDFGWGLLWLNIPTWDWGYKWACPVCHPPLGLSRKRRAVAAVLIGLELLATTLTALYTLAPVWAVFPTAIGVAVLIFRWCDSVESQEHTDDLPL